ncbi:hypothetical protein MRX96_058017, partial [Rhipicephalus microplus]
SPQIADIIVRQTDVTNLQHERNRFMLKVKCGSLWTKSTPILMSPESGEHFFLQTEKPIYRPGESVNVRFLAVDGRLKPSKSIFRLEVRNPQNLIVERTEFQPQRDLLLTHTYQLPERTLLGEWSLLMKHGYNFEQNATSKFLVDKYVLPRFKVDLSIPDYVLSNFSTLPCSVAASFVNKKARRRCRAFHIWATGRSWRRAVVFKQLLFNASRRRQGYVQSSARAAQTTLWIPLGYTVRQPYAVGCESNSHRGSYWS